MTTREQELLDNIQILLTTFQKRGCVTMIDKGFNKVLHKKIKIEIMIMYKEVCTYYTFEVINVDTIYVEVSTDSDMKNLLMKSEVNMNSRQYLLMIYHIMNSYVKDLIK